MHELLGGGELKADLIMLCLGLFYPSPGLCEIQRQPQTQAGAQATSAIAVADVGIRLAIAPFRERYPRIDTQKQFRIVAGLGHFDERLSCGYTCTSLRHLWPCLQR